MMKQRDQRLFVVGMVIFACAIGGVIVYSVALAMGVLLGVLGVFFLGSYVILNERFIAQMREGGTRGGELVFFRIESESQPNRAKH